MKKLIFGLVLFLTRMLSDAVLLGGAMANEWVNNGKLSAFWNLSQYGLMPAFYLFAVTAFIGLVLAVWGMLERK